MSIRNLDCIFKPERVAVVGASENPTSAGYTVLRNLIRSGFHGVVYPVNPKRESVQGIQAYPDVASLPKRPDLAVISTPAQTVPDIVDQCGQAGIMGVVVISAGFREVGEGGKALEERLREVAGRYDGMRIVGPNCLGIIVPGRKLNASITAATPKQGRVAFISQSGALNMSVVDWATSKDIGFSYFASLGNMLDVDFADLIDYLGEDASTRSIILYVESIPRAREFMSASRAFAREKPIVVYKAGRFAESAQAVFSHTGAMAGEDAVYDAAFQRAGLVRVFKPGDILDCAELLARVRPPAGNRLAIVTNGGGPGVMAADALIARGGTLAQLSADTVRRLNEVQPPFWSQENPNPVDVLEDAPPERYRQALAAVLSDSEVDAALVILTPQGITDPTGTAEAVAEVANEARKPIVAAWMGGTVVQEGIQVLNQSGVPTYPTPERAVEAFIYLVHYRRNLELLYETPREVPVRFTVSRESIRRKFDRVLGEEGPVLTEKQSKELLSAYGIAVTTPWPAASAEEAVARAEEVGYPVVLKVFSPQITHKTEVGGVALSLHNAGEVREAFNSILSAARQRQPDAELAGVTVQKMLTPAHRFEMILGAKKDPTFGAVIMIGMGGITTEIFQDQALGLPPLNERLAQRMLESLRSWKLIQGYRGRQGANLDKLVEALIRFSYLITDFPQIKELDINPLLVTPDDVVALDARVIVDEEAVCQLARPYAHLAIRPYPEGYEREVKLADGTNVLLRPIRPEDEPLWCDMLSSSREESIYFRYFHFFKITHEMATRYCFIDYDRTLAIVAIVDEGGEQKMAGAGRIVADPDVETAEHAVFVADPWQNRGLGRMLTDYCLKIATEWGIRKITAEILPENTRMVNILRNRGFVLERRAEEGMVLATKKLK